MSYTRPAEDQQDWAPQGAATIRASDSARKAAAGLIGDCTAALAAIGQDQGDAESAGALLRSAGRLADLVVSTARADGATWDGLARLLRGSLADVHQRWGRVNSDRPTTPRDEDDAALSEQMREYSLAGIGLASARRERDEAIRQARRDGATYEQLGAASGLRRAMLDRIVNDRDY